MNIETKVECPGGTCCYPSKAKSRYSCCLGSLPYNSATSVHLALCLKIIAYLVHYCYASCSHRSCRTLSISYIRPMPCPPLHLQLQLALAPALIIFSPFPRPFSPSFSSTICPENRAMHHQKMLCLHQTGANHTPTKPRIHCFTWKVSRKAEDALP